jgi:hypothetical protein
LIFEAPLAEPTLPAQLGELFGLEMDALLGNGRRFIVPRLGSQP